MNTRNFRELITILVILVFLLSIFLPPILGFKIDNEIVHDILGLVGIVLAFYFSAEHANGYHKDNH